MVKEITTLFKSPQGAFSNIAMMGGYHPASHRKGSDLLGQLRASIEVIRSYLLVAWQLKLLSHGGLHELAGVLESVSKQAARWQQWFRKGGAS